MNPRFLLLMLLAVFAFVGSTTFGQEAVAPAEPKSVIKMFSLQHADADEVQRIVRELLGAGDGRVYSANAGRGSRISVSPLKTSYDPRTNTLLINGPAKMLEEIEALVMRLDVPADKNSPVGAALGAANAEKRIAKLEEDVERLQRLVRARPPQRTNYPVQNQGVRATPAPAAAGETQIRPEVLGTSGATLRIESIVAAGTQVAKGDVLVKLDSAPLAREVNAQRIKLESAEAAFKQVQIDHERAIAEAKSRQVEAQQKQSMAALELNAYQEGERAVALKELETAVQIAKLEVVRQKRLAAAAKLDAVAVQQTEMKLEIAELKLNVFKTYVATKRISELKRGVDSANQAIDNSRLDIKSLISGSEARLVTQKILVDAAKQELAESQRRLALCQVLAPHDGEVVEVPSWDRLRKGSLVRHGQVILLLRPWSKPQSTTETP